MKRGLFQLHRWLGVALGAAFVLWFASGFVMVFVAFPSLTWAERLAGAEPIDLRTCRITAGQAWLTTGRSGTPERTLLTTLNGRPVWRFFSSSQDGWAVIHADDGSPVPPLTADRARSLALAFAHQSSTPAPHDHGRAELDFKQIAVTSIERDQWTAHPRFNPHRPLFRVQLPDTAGTVLHVSPTTAEVVLDSSRHERAWNWLGAVPHWIYFTAIRQSTPLWRAITITGSSVGVALVLTGLIAGLLRWRFRRADPYQARTPYSGWRKWHHLAGLSFGCIALTWIFSGLLSMNPASWFDGESPTTAQRTAWRGGNWDWSLFKGTPAILADEPRPRIIELVQFANQSYFVCHAPSVSPTLHPWDNSRALSEPRLDHTALIAHAKLLLPGHSLIRSSELRNHDAHFYTHLWRSPAPLPMFRAEFDDPAGTWFHLDPHTAQIFNCSTANSRLYRWLYHGLHSLDFPWLQGHPRTWIGTKLFLLSGGLFLSLTGTILAAKRLFLTQTPSPAQPSKSSL